MGTKDRRRREVAGREQLFLNKARDLVCAEGLLQLQMTRLAEECDYAIGTLYQHFGSKEDLIVALLTDRVDERTELFRRAAAWDASSRDRMFAVAAAEALFVQRNPEYFKIAQLALTQVIWSAASVSRRHEYLAKTTEAQGGSPRQANQEVQLTSDCPDVAPQRRQIHVGLFLNF